MMRIGRVAAGAVAGAVAATGLGAAAGAQITNIDLRLTNGGFTQQTLVSNGVPVNNPWTWTAGTGWQVNGRTDVSRQRLLSPVLTNTVNAFAVVATHQYNFEQNTLNGNCFDGGALFASVNGGAFAQITSGVSGQGYVGTVSNLFGNPLAGLQAFCGTSGGLVTTTVSVNAPVGTTIQLALDGAWDNSFAEANPNWLLQQVELRNLAPAQVIPEPSTYVLLGAGLLALGGLRRRAAR